MNSCVARAVSLAILFSPLIVLLACEKHPSATQTAVRVNGGEITVFQLNGMLSQMPPDGSGADNTSVSPILEHLIDQELLDQKARELKLERNPQVEQALDAAKRTVLASAYLQQITGDLPKPTEREIDEFFVGHPEFFSGRRSFAYRVVAIHASHAQVAIIEQQFSDSKDVENLLVYLRNNNIAFVTNAISKTTEQLPTVIAGRLSTLKDGEAINLPSASGLELVQLMSSHPDPVGKVQARPFIERYLTEQRRDERAAFEINALRRSATIEYLGNFKPPPKIQPPSSSADAVRSE